MSQIQPTVLSAGEVLTSAAVYFGPEMPGWGSWEWVGADLQRELGKYFRTECFRRNEIPSADVIFVIKHLPPDEWVRRVAKHSALVYCPIDSYGGAGQIDADGAILRQFARIVVHSPTLRRYFEPYAPTTYLDHHLKFVAPAADFRVSGGFILWIGVHSNLEPLVDWLAGHPTPCDLLILTNLERGDLQKMTRAIRLRAGDGIYLETWTPAAHLKRISEAKAALDIKGRDFRSRHKPPAKALDFLGSGLPLAMNPDSGVVAHLASAGFAVPSPEDEVRWLSRGYWEETNRFGEQMREMLSLERIGKQYKAIVDSLLIGKQLGSRLEEGSVA